MLKQISYHQTMLVLQVSITRASRACHGAVRFIKRPDFYKAARRCLFSFVALDIFESSFRPVSHSFREVVSVCSPCPASFAQRLTVPPTSTANPLIHIRPSSRNGPSRIECVVSAERGRCETTGRHR